MAKAIDVSCIGCLIQFLILDAKWTPIRNGKSHILFNLFAVLVHKQLDTAVVVKLEQRRRCQTTPKRTLSCEQWDDQGDVLRPFPTNSRTTVDNLQLRDEIEISRSTAFSDSLGISAFYFWLTLRVCTFRTIRSIVAVKLLWSRAEASVSAVKRGSLEAHSASFELKLVGRTTCQFQDTENKGSPSNRSQVLSFGKSSFENNIVVCADRRKTETIGK